VTGGAGFIGSNLARTLSIDNNVTVIDNLSTGNIENIRDLIDAGKIDFTNGSITDLNLLQESFKNIDYVFHQAAIPSVPRSVDDPIRSNDANINGTLNVLFASKENGVKKVVYASSSSVYGDTPTLPKKEEMIPNPLSPYAVSKLAGEYYCEVFNKVYNLQTVSLRYFNVYGPRQDPNGAYAAVIPKFITSIINHKSPVIYGDGEQSRDFSFISDVIQANIKAADSSTDGVFNVAKGGRITLNSLTEILMELIGNSCEIIYENPRPGDIKHSYADVSKAVSHFDYQPCYEIREGLKETIKWFQN
jgi:UDP-glucose 4-epimerase